MRRVQAVDLMLFGTVLLWALNSTVTRYVLTHGFQPARVRDGPLRGRDGALLGLHLLREGSFRIALRDLRYVAIAALAVYVNQLCFVYAVDKTSAATVTLFLGTTPIFIGVVASVVGLERLGRGVLDRRRSSRSSASRSSRSGSGGFSGRRRRRRARRRALRRPGARTRSPITPLMRRYSPFRISSLVLLLGWIPLAITGLPQTAQQDFHFGSSLMWLGVRASPSSGRSS